MLKMYADSRNRCYLHPHRAAELKCDRCKTGLCSECVREYQGQHVCENCLNELELAEASKPTLGERVRGSLITFRNAAIVVVIVVALCGGAFYAFRGTLNQPITPEQLARFRYAASGSFQTAEGINVNSTVLSAKVVSFTSQRVGFEATHLINEYVGDGYPGWRSTDATFPQEVVVQGQGLTAVSKVILTQQPGEPAETLARDFEVDVSAQDPNPSWVTIGHWQAQQIGGPEHFTFPVTPTKLIRLRILSNYGSTQYTSLGEFDAYAIPVGPGPQAAP